MCDPGAGGGERVLAIGDNGPLFLSSCDGGRRGGGGPDFRIADGDADAVGERGAGAEREGESGGEYEP